MKYLYPAIEIREKSSKVLGTEFSLHTIIRIERGSIWYEITIHDKYPEITEEYLSLFRTKCYAIQQCYIVTHVNHEIRESNVSLSKIQFSEADRISLLKAIMLEGQSNVIGSL